MPIFVELLQPTLPPGQPVVDSVVRAVMPQIDGCPIFTRTKAFVVNQGTAATLEHVFRDRAGVALDLTVYFPNSGSSGSSLSASETAGYALVARAKDWLGIGLSARRNPVWTMPGAAVAAASGVVRVDLPAGLVELPGIYELSWAVLDPAGRPVVTNDGLLSVERSLWPADVLNLFTAKGPPTLNEIRLLLMDASGNENVLIADIEFKDEQILMASTKPVQAWNEAMPPILPFTTRDFPFRGAWATGTLGQLHFIAANHYRRNLLRHAAGGQEVADKDKEREYLAEGQRLWKTYTDWVGEKKVSLNMKRFYGTAISAYSTHSGW